MKTILVNFRFLPAFLLILLLFSSNSFAKKARGAKELLEEVDKKGIELNPEKRKFLEDAVQQEEKLDAEYREYRRTFFWKWIALKGKWKAVLADKVQDANKIEIRSIPWDNESKVLYTINGNNKVKEFLNLLEITESGITCACYGHAFVVFLKNDEEIVKLGWHGSRLRWYGGSWTSDALLSEKAIVELPKWFSAQGYSGFDDGVEEALKEYKMLQTDRRIFIFILLAVAAVVILSIYGVYKVSKRIFYSNKNIQNKL